MVPVLVKGSELEKILVLVSAAAGFLTRMVLQERALLLLVAG